MPATSSRSPLAPLAPASAYDVRDLSQQRSFLWMLRAVVQAIASGTLDTVRGGRLIAVLGPEEIQEKLEKLESMMIAEQNDEQ
jgi:hypothetical protein